MILKIAGVSLSLAMLMMAPGPAFAQDSATASEATSPGPGQGTPALVPSDFVVPAQAEADSFKLLPLGPDVVDVDFAAYMSSIEHLQATFTRSTDWPHANLSAADAMRDMENEQTRFRERKSFAYAVLTPDGKRERGSVYVSPSPVDGYDAVVRLWVTKAEYDAGFDTRLYSWVTAWIAEDWPFARVAYPGRAIAWKDWDALVAAQKAGA